MLLPDVLPERAPCGCQVVPVPAAQRVALDLRDVTRVAVQADQADRRARASAEREQRDGDRRSDNERRNREREADRAASPRRADQRQPGGRLVGRERLRQPRLDRAQAEDLPASLDALELADAAILEACAGAGDQIHHGAGRQDLSRPGECHDPRADVHCDAAELAVDLLALAGVHAGAHVDAELLNGQDDRRST